MRKKKRDKGRSKKRRKRRRTRRTRRKKERKELQKKKQSCGYKERHCRETWTHRRGCRVTLRQGPQLHRGLRPNRDDTTRACYPAGNVCSSEASREDGSCGGSSLDIKSMIESRSNAKVGCRVYRRYHTRPQNQNPHREQPQKHAPKRPVKHPLTVDAKNPSAPPPPTSPLPPPTKTYPHNPTNPP